MNFRRKRWLLVWGMLSISAFLGCWLAIAPLFKGKKAPVTSIATVLKPSASLSKFSLIDTNNKLFTERSLKGHWNVLFFGYTDCPHICPATLTIVRDAWKSFNNKAPARFIFASINSEEDPPEKLKQFLSRFDNKFKGITGKRFEMDKLSKQLGVFARQIKGDAIEDDIIDHTAALMLLDPQARLRAIFTPPFDPESLAKDIKILTAGKG